ncbi:MAG TPA: DUF6428 family protein [Bacteroidia bacterium]|nr:DUF6428 family protein [Bacteroidia bacterium]
MKLSELNHHLGELTQLNLVLPGGEPVPAHFHITEAGLTTKHFVDCGGTVRTEKYANLQVWVAQDTDHRLSPVKLKNILDIAKNLFEGEDPEVEIEYQSQTIGRYGLDFRGNSFQFTPKRTDCLAGDQCGVPAKKKVKLSELQTASSSCCTPGGGCC